MTAWNESKAVALATLRVAYLAEVERLAETLRADFAAGDLYGYRSTDEGAGRTRLEQRAAEHFGLTLTERHEDGCLFLEGDAATARMILAVSPSADLAEDLSVGVTYDHPAQHAEEAVALDVLALARERRWYQPTEDELSGVA